MDEDGKWRRRQDNTCCNVNDCGPMSICTETFENAFNKSGFECTCLPAYKMIDNVCTQTDPCLDNNGGCHVDANCAAKYAENGIGSAICGCKEGFNGDGINCRPNSCDVKNGNCHFRAKCAQ